MTVKMSMSHSPPVTLSNDVVFSEVFLIFFNDSVLCLCVGSFVLCLSIPYGLDNGSGYPLMGWFQFILVFSDECSCYGLDTSGACTPCPF